MGLDSKELRRLAKEQIKAEKKRNREINTAYEQRKRAKQEITDQTVAKFEDFLETNTDWQDNLMKNLKQAFEYDRYDRYYGYRVSFVMFVSEAERYVDLVEEDSYKSELLSLAFRIKREDSDDINCCSLFEENLQGMNVQDCYDVLEQSLEKLNKVLRRYKITAIVGNPRLGNSYHDEEVIDTLTTIRKTVTRYYADVFLHIK